MGCAVLVVAAIWVWVVHGQPAAALLVTAPVLLCGVTTLVAGETLWPQLALLLAVPATLAGVVLGLSRGGGQAISSVARRRLSPSK